MKRDRDRAARNTKKHGASREFYAENGAFDGSEFSPAQVFFIFFCAASFALLRKCMIRKPCTHQALRASESFWFLEKSSVIAKCCASLVEKAVDASTGSGYFNNPRGDVQLFQPISPVSFSLRSCGQKGGVSVMAATKKKAAPAKKAAAPAKKAAPKKKAAAKPAKKK